MANEKRLANAEAIARKLKNAHCAECTVVRKIQCSACWVEDVLELLEGDAVDAEPVVHGHWVKYNFLGHEQYACSECQTLGSPQWKRCPVCEAKMDKKENP